ncbi:MULTISPECIES: hypothetical protein [Trichocoleus]|uniref:DUF11 domain-containing protein n=1 Tax=Trichocoleus desertorum GB2-A4 TaxID=2933944 RepID=A0ABV0J9C6_9CYAN|nr:hypothetical protein [Trichocoleus sp. FACHB-46]MBD1864757.1 hypothetical protein [Trichocoleus sp. FACHB-46]
MKSNNRTSVKPKFNYRSLVAGLFIAGGVFQLVTPVLAAPAANTTISNTATASYTDPSTGTTLSATSNTVTVTVAEVAGIDVSALNTPGSAQPGGTLNYDFKITNTGNDPTRFVLPSTASITGTGAAGASISQIITAGADGVLGNADDQTIAVGGAPLLTGSIAANGIINVRVVLAIAANAAPGTVTVEYGKSVDPASTNQVYAANGALDIYTNDNTDPSTVPGEVAGAPVNGTREDSATLDGVIGNVAGVLNGTNGNAAATGDGTNNNTDFTNKAVAPTDSKPGSTANDPGVVTFTNTLSNTGNAPATFLLRPDAPGSTVPAGTTATITAGGTTGTFTWNGTAWTGTPVTVSVAPGTPVNYTVTVDLPAGTKLSTDLTTPGDLTSPTAAVVGGYAMPILAFVDSNNDGIAQVTEPQNLTIERTYLGYVAMYKEAQILEADGTTVVQAFTTDATALTGKLTPGRIVEYRISYKNISETAAATTGSSILNATNLQIVEDGTTGGNNWALDQDGNTIMDTVHVSGIDAGGTIVTTGTDPNITKYVDTISSLAPGASGKLDIRRKMSN